MDVPLLSAATANPCCSSASWDEIETRMHANVSRHSDYTLTSTHSGCTRVYALQNTRLSFVKPDPSRTEIRFASGKHVKAKAFAHEADALRYTSLIAKYMLVAEAITHLEHVRLALARDCLPDSDTVHLDIILNPKNRLTTPGYKMVAVIPASDTIVATVTFSERFWIAPTPEPVVDKFKAKHFETVQTLVDFIRKERKHWIRKR